MKLTLQMVTMMVLIYAIGHLLIACGGPNSILRNGEDIRTLVIKESDGCTYYETGPNKGKWVCGRDWMIANDVMLDELFLENDWYKQALDECWGKEF